MTDKIAVMGSETHI